MRSVDAASRRSATAPGEMIAVGARETVKVDLKAAVGCFRNL